MAIINQELSQYGHSFEIMTREENIKEQKYLYTIMELTMEDAMDSINKIKFDNDPMIAFTMKNITIRQFNANNPQDVKLLTEIFNIVLLTSSEPYRPLSQDEIEKYFRNGTYLAFMFGRCIGYIITSIEWDPIDGKIGIIAGIGVHPSRRRKKIGQVLIIDSLKRFFYYEHVASIQCEVYSENETSQNFIKSFGFKPSRTIMIN